ncbi:hypothetical protein GIB67_027994 [Kingdonia uniflora]|uniref:Reverse transcriptase zinc-binding domain-containing protein n=1 Tax=Kingdonia uniflora TaxID=39325 RepID=A0A7J7L757_9MAGN|nr:hypothetical protein GIB67_027994 [Kingdonia uniflora]
MAARQWIYYSKSKLFLGTMTVSKKRNVEHFLRIKQGSFPENYLGIQLVQVRIKASNLKIMVDKIKKMANSYVGKLLSFQGRIVLAKSILNSIPIYNMAVYNDLSLSLKNVRESWDWHEKTERRKYGHVDESGFEYSSKEDTWAQYMRAKYFTKTGDIIGYYKKSSMWKGIKEAYIKVKKHSKWLIATGKKVDIWKDNWALNTALSGQILVEDTMGVHAHTVSDLLQHGTWNWDNAIGRLIQSLGDDFSKLFVNHTDSDRCIFTLNTRGNFSVPSAHEHIRKKSTICWWNKMLWRNNYSPRQNNLAWWIFQNALPTDDRVQKQQIKLASMCSLCKQHSETQSHLFLSCLYALNVWWWALDLFELNIVDWRFVNLFKLAKNRSTYIQDLWLNMVMAILNYIWISRNETRWEDKRVPTYCAKIVILSQALQTGQKESGRIALKILGS